nr:hypothetical protein [uncultured Dyadobacter sp.]
MVKINYLSLFLVFLVLLASCSDKESVRPDQNFTKNLPGVYKYTQYNSYYQVDYSWTITRIDDKAVRLSSEIAYTIYSGTAETYRDTIDNIAVSEPDQFRFNYESTGPARYKLDASGKVDGDVLNVKLLTTWTVSPQERYDLKLEKQL